mgnify:FL=1
MWNYRSFILGLAARDFRIRYMNSFLGSLWAVLNPFAQILVYTLVFSQVMMARLPGIDSAFAYSIYLCAGIINWQYFSEVLTRMQNIFIEHAELLKKVHFPRTSLPLFVVISSSINYVIMMGIFILFLVAVGQFAGWPVLAMLPLLFFQICFAVGLGTFLATLNVFFRDVGHFMGIVLQFWFWLTPIVYPRSIVPERFVWIQDINPMSWLMRSYQDIFLLGEWPEWTKGWPLMMSAIVLLFLGYAVFKRLDKEMVDEL